MSTEDPRPVPEGDSMELNAIVEVIVHCESFRNIDLFSQGLYAVRCYVYTDYDHRLAIPFTCVSGSNEGDLNTSTVPLSESKYSAHIDHEKHALSTRSFVVRFREQLVELNDIGYYRLQLPVTEDRVIPIDSAIFEFEMRFIDLTAQKVKDNPNEAEFKTVARHLFKVADIASGVHRQIPVNFDEMHFCQMNVMVHSALVDYRLKPSSTVVEPPTRSNIPKRLRQRFKPKMRRFHRLYRSVRAPSSRPSPRRRRRGVGCMSACSRPEGTLGGTDGGGHDIESGGEYLRPHFAPGSTQLIHHDFYEALQESLTTLGDSYRSFLDELRPGVRRVSTTREIARHRDSTVIASRRVPKLATNTHASGLSLGDSDDSGSNDSDRERGLDDPTDSSDEEADVPRREVRDGRAVSVSDVVTHTPPSDHRANPTDSDRSRDRAATDIDIDLKSASSAVGDTGDISGTAALVDPHGVLGESRPSHVGDSPPAVPLEQNSGGDSGLNKGKGRMTSTPTEASDLDASSDRKSVPLFIGASADNVVRDAAAFAANANGQSTQSPTKEGSDSSLHDVVPVATTSNEKPSSDPSGVAPHNGDLPEYVDLNELHIVAMGIYHVWHELAGLFYAHPSDLSELLASTYKQNRLLKWNESIQRETHALESLTLPVETSDVQAEVSRASRLRRVINSHLWLPLEIENLADYNQPIIYERRYRPQITDTPELGESGGSREPTPVVSSAAQPSTSPATAAWAPPAHLQRESSGLGIQEEAGPAEIPRQPPLFPRESHESDTSEPVSYAGSHLFVFVHGFQGNPYDLRLMKDYILISNPGAEFLLSAVNRHNTMSDIQDMGNALADEIRRHIQKKRLVIGRLSFVCHSLGSVIARAALQCDELRPFRSRLYLYMSLSGPHLGIVYNRNTLLNSAMWLMRRSKKSVALSQLSLADAATQEDTFLYKLSQAPSFEYFRHVALVSSPQDRYVPIHSSRLEICANALDDPKSGSVYIRMVHNICSRLTAGQVTRYSVHFDTSRSLDSAIGRAAHIEFLENMTWMEMFVDTNPHMFT